VIWRVLLLAAMLGGAAAGRQYALVHKAPLDSAARLPHFPDVLGPWHAAGNIDLDARTLSLLGADEYLNRIYRTSTGAIASVYVGYYRSQQQGAAIHSPLNCLPGAGWQPVTTNRVALTNGPDAPLVNRLVVRKGETRQIVYYWYQSHGRITASDYWSKFYLVADAVTRRGSDAALVRVVVPDLSDASGGSDGDQGRALAALAATAVRQTVFPQ
jgi:EpsI family protein